MFRAKSALGGKRTYLVSRPDLWHRRAMHRYIRAISIGACLLLASAAGTVVHVPPPTAERKALVEQLVANMRLPEAARDHSSPLRRTLDAALVGSLVRVVPRGTAEADDDFRQRLAIRLRPEVDRLLPQVLPAATADLTYELSTSPLAPSDDVFRGELAVRRAEVRFTAHDLWVVDRLHKRLFDALLPLRFQIGADLDASGKTSAASVTR